jgi:hypothetical protein
VGLSGFTMSGGAMGLGLASGPKALLGKYAAVQASAAVGVGAGAGTGLRLSNGAATINVSLHGQTGLGAGVELLSVELIDAGRGIEKVSEKTAVAVAAPVVEDEEVKVAQAKAIAAVTPAEPENPKYIIIDPNRVQAARTRDGRAVYVMLVPPTK